MDRTLLVYRSSDLTHEKDCPGGILFNDVEERPVKLHIVPDGSFPHLHDGCGSGLRAFLVHVDEGLVDHPGNV